MVRLPGGRGSSLGVGVDGVVVEAEVEESRGSNEQVGVELVSDPGVGEGLAVPRFDWRGFIADDFKDALFRSREVRSNLFELKAKSVNVLNAVLDAELTEKTMPSVLKAAQYVLDNCMVQFPELSHRTVEMEVHNSGTSTVKVERGPMVTKDEVMDAVLIASKAERHRGSRSVDDSSKDVELPTAQHEVGVEVGVHHEGGKR